MLFNLHLVDPQPAALLTSRQSLSIYVASPKQFANAQILKYAPRFFFLGKPASHTVMANSEVFQFIPNLGLSGKARFQVHIHTSKPLRGVIQ